MFKHFVFATLLIVSPFIGSFANADLIYELDFNTETSPGSGDFNPNFDQADSTAISTLTYADGTGADGTRAVQVDFDTSDAPFSVAYFTNLAGSQVNAATSSNLSDYTLSFDVRIEGFDAGQSQVSTAYSITLNDSRFSSTLNSTAAFQTVTQNLGALTNTGTGGAGAFDLSDFTTGTRQFRASFLDVSNRLGQDNDNRYFIDNIRLTQAVPEPAALGLFAFGFLAMAGRRNRRS